MTPFSTALVTASASAWVRVPSVTALSSLVFNAAARSAWAAVRSSSSAAVTLDSSIPSDSASDLARAASLRCAVRLGALGRRGGGLVGFAEGLQRLGHLGLVDAELGGQFGGLGAAAVPAPAMAVPPRIPSAPVVPGVASAEALELGRRRSGGGGGGHPGDSKRRRRGPGPRPKWRASFSWCVTCAVSWFGRAATAGSGDCLVQDVVPVCADRFSGSCSEPFMFL